MKYLVFFRQWIWIQCGCRISCHFSDLQKWEVVLLIYLTDGGIQFRNRSISDAIASLDLWSDYLAALLGKYCSVILVLKSWQGFCVLYFKQLKRIFNHKLIPRCNYLSLNKENRTGWGFLCLLYCSMLFSGIKLAIYNWSSRAALTLKITSGSPSWFLWVLTPARLSGSAARDGQTGHADHNFNSSLMCSRVSFRNSCYRLFFLNFFLGKCKVNSGSLV